MSISNTISTRQSEILDKALDLVVENGISGLTIRKIADRMNFSEPALYRHFSNKQAVILGLMDRLDSMLLDTARAIGDDSSLPPRERLSRIITHHVQLIRKYNGLPILLLAEASVSDDPILLERMRAIIKAYFDLLTDLVDQGQKDGTLTSTVQPDCFALGLMGMPTSLAVHHRLLPNSVLEDRIENEWLPFFLDRIGAKGGGTS